MKASVCVVSKCFYSLCVVRVAIVYTKGILCVCEAAVWSLCIRCVLKVIVSRACNDVRVTEEMQAIC